MYDIEFNGETAKSHGVWIVQRPDIPLPTLKYESYDVPGRDGSLISSYGTYEDIEISVEMNYIAKADSWMQKYREIRRWLLQDGDKRLILGDDSDFFYQAKYVTIKKNERELKRKGTFTAKFQCAPHQYLVSGLDEYDHTDVLENNYDVCHPIYYIVGNGDCELTVNGNTMSATVGVNLTINTELMMAYKSDGTLMNTSITGDYEDLYLQEGTNTIEITDGFTLTVVPNWRCI